MSENEHKGDRRRSPAVAGADCTSEVATNASAQNLLQYPEWVVYSVAGSKLASMDIGKIDDILTRYLTNNRGVENAVLVSDEYDVINNPIQEWAEEDIYEMVTVILHVDHRTQNSLGWTGLEQIWMYAKDSYFIAVRCSRGFLLLIKATQPLKPSQLRLIISDAVKALQGVLDSEEPPHPEPDNGAASARHNSKAALETGDEIIYRGRKSRPS